MVPERRGSQPQVLDVDRFKRFNDRYGHQADLACVAVLMRAAAELYAAKRGGRDRVDG